MARCIPPMVFLKGLVRRKAIHSDSGSSSLSRCLTTMDLTFLGIGSTLGLGMYIIAGQVAATLSGPSVILSFFIAALASVFAGLCYAEFGARVPKAGSAYVYSYVTVGEFVAFIIGWNLILEYVIGTASVARGYSGYIDSLFGKTMASYFTKVIPIGISNLSPFPDFLSFAITMVLTGLLAFGVKESTKFNNVFTILNLLVVVYAVICGIFKADLHNWNLSKDEIPSTAGVGGFFAFGIPNMLAGAAKCFYCFVGFDCVATSGEEVKNPQRAIPISIVASLFTVFLTYSGISAIQTLIWPYYDQDQAAPLPYVFECVGWTSASWIITIGALFGLSTSLLGAMFPLPRILYAMGSDGVIYRWLAKVDIKFKTPLIATILSGIFSGFMAMMFDIDQLTQMMSIGTLLAYSLVAICVLILRYQQQPPPPVDMSTSVQVSSSVMMSTQIYTKKEFLRQFLNLDKLKEPTQLSSTVSVSVIVITGVIIIVLDLLLIKLENDLGEIYMIVIISFLGSLIATCCVSLMLQPTDQTKISFKAPFMPFTSVLSVFANIYLMLKLDNVTWIRFGVWMAIGFAIYFSYGYWNSSERTKRSGLIQPDPTSNLTNSRLSDSDDFITRSNEKSPLVR